jgi:hypothetical protein
MQEMPSAKAGIERALSSPNTTKAAPANQNASDEPTSAPSFAKNGQEDGKRSLTNFQRKRTPELRSWEGRKNSEKSLCQRRNMKKAYRVFQWSCYLGVEHSCNRYHRNTSFPGGMGRTNAGGTFIPNWKMSVDEAPEKVMPSIDGTTVVGVVLEVISKKTVSSMMLSEMESTGQQGSPEFDEYQDETHASTPPSKPPSFSIAKVAPTATSPAMTAETDEAIHCTWSAVGIRTRQG